MVPACLKLPEALLAAFRELNEHSKALDTWGGEGGSQPQRARGLGLDLGAFLEHGHIECFWCGSAVRPRDMVYHGHFRIRPRRVCCPECPVVCREM